MRAFVLGFPLLVALRLALAQAAWQTLPLLLSTTTLLALTLTILLSTTPGSRAQRAFPSKYVVESQNFNGLRYEHFHGRKLNQTLGNTSWGTLLSATCL